MRAEFPKTITAERYLLTGTERFTLYTLPTRLDNLSFIMLLGKWALCLVTFSRVYNASLIIFRSNVLLHLFHFRTSRQNQKEYNVIWIEMMATLTRYMSLL